VRGRALAAVGRASAGVEVLRAATERLDRGGARLWLIEGLLALGALAAEGDVDVDLAADAYARAHEVTCALDHVGAALAAGLWARDAPAMQVSVIGTKEVTVGGVPVRLGDRPEQLVLAVLLAGPSGAHWESVATWLWPDEADAGKLKSRVSSATNLARKGLGAQAWRLARDASLLRVHRLGLEVDLDAEAEQFDATGVVPVTASDPVLPMWAEVEWVVDVEERRQERFDRPNDRGDGPGR